jgi:hypothetical protein
MPALVAGIHVLSLFRPKDVDGRDEPGHDAYIPNGLCIYIPVACSTI